ncbi:MAG: DUF4917 domain-containing protein [Piscirickettsiaceae bacterium]|nr:MAG: DUF4917 domain-containing protein [Piscirickettsiaceae bacterium]
MLTFLQAINDSEKYLQRHALLGNGFSISCRPDIFVYGKLFERADFSDLSSSAKLAFEALGTQDFEKVIKVLRDASVVLTAYKGSLNSLIQQLKEDADGLREVLVQAIASSHPEWPGEISDVEYMFCQNFLKNFKNVYTLNYDLLLYWAVMHDDEDENKIKSDDGFRTPEDNFDSEYVVWEAGTSRSQNIWYLHGALHVFDAGTEIQKYTWVNTGQRLIEQIRDALERDYFPLFVAEGTSEEKLERIMHSEYLAKGKRSFSSIGGALFIHGHSLATNDEHFLKTIEKGKIKHLYVGLFGDENSPNNKAIKARALLIASNRAKKKLLNVSFYDSASAKVWG